MDPAGLTLDDLRSLSARQWVRLDTDLRRGWAPPQEITDLRTRVLAACHRNGFAREAAVSDAPHEPLMSAVLALRAADWVPQVRARARTEFDRMLATGRVDLWTLGAEVAVRVASRTQGGWLLDRLGGVIASLPVDELRRLGPEFRRRAYRTRTLDPSTLLTAALRDPDLVVRREAAQSLVRRTTDVEILRLLLAARTPIVRADGLAALVRAGYTDDAFTSLSDKHTLVRRIAQVGVRQAGGDPAAFYQKLLNTEMPPEWAVAGLGETGSAADVGLLRRSLRHPVSRARVAAARAIRRLDAVVLEDFVPLIDDPSPAVVREAVAAIAPLARQLDRDLLVRLMAPGNALPTRMAGYRLLSAGDRWERLIADLALIDDPDTVLRTLGRGGAGTWPRHYGATAYAAPTPAQAAELIGLLDRAVGVLDPKLISLLRFHAGL